MTKPPFRCTFMTLLFGSPAVKTESPAICWLACANRVQVIKADKIAVQAFFITC